MIIDPYTWHRLPIHTIMNVASDTVAVRLTRPPGYSFRAGQYAVVRVTTGTGEQLMRQYSFSSAPSNQDLELLIQHEPEGVVSSWFCLSAREGDEIELSQPLGNFTLDKTSSRPVLLIAGRVGVAPFISMLRDGRVRKLTVLYSVRTPDQVCFLPLLRQHGAIILETRSSPRISKKFLKTLLENKPLVYVCGSKQFVDSLTGVLKELDIMQSDIKRELFTLQ